LQYIQKSCDEEEYSSPLKRESGCPQNTDAERLLEGKDEEGSFRAGEPKAGISER